MSDATLAAAFVMMIIAPCAVALIGERSKDKTKKDQAASLPPNSSPRPSRSSGSHPAVSFTRLPRPLHDAATMAAPRGAGPIAAVPTRVVYAKAQSALTHPQSSYAQPRSSYTQPETLTSQGLDPYAHAASLYSQALRPADPPASTLTPLQQAAERAEAEALLAQAAAAKANAAALMAAAKAAQAKANAAAEVAAQTARAAEVAHQAAAAERDLQAQITAQEHARTASGEHLLPESHPSLDFPRSRRDRRAA